MRRYHENWDDEDDPIVRGTGDDCLFNLFVMLIIIMIFGAIIIALIKS